MPSEKAPPVGAMDSSVSAKSAPVKSPSAWAKAKSTPLHYLAGAYFACRWERDGDGNDLSLCSETDFDAAIADVANSRFVAAHQQIQR